MEAKMTRYFIVERMTGTLAHQMDQCEVYFREWIASGYRDIAQHDEWLAWREKVMATKAEMRRNYSCTKEGARPLLSRC